MKKYQKPSLQAIEVESAELMAASNILIDKDTVVSGDNGGWSNEESEFDLW